MGWLDSLLGRVVGRGEDGLLPSTLQGTRNVATYGHFPYVVVARALTAGLVRCHLPSPQPYSVPVFPASISLAPPTMEHQVMLWRTIPKGDVLYACKDLTVEFMCFCSASLRDPDPCYGLNAPTEYPSLLPGNCFRTSGFPFQGESWGLPKGTTLAPSLWQVSYSAKRPACMPKEVHLCNPLRPK